MKKMVIYFGLMMALATAAFAKPVVFDAEEYFVVADDEYDIRAFNDDYSDERKVEIYKSLMLEEINGRKVVFHSYVFAEVDTIASKYNSYMLISDDQTHMFVFENLGDGRMLMLCYLLVKE